jgi:hypothetical protein
VTEGLRLHCFRVAVVADESESPPADSGDKREIHIGAEVGTISNNKKVSKSAAAMYARILLWVGLYTFRGYGLMVYKMSVLFLGPSLPRSPAAFDCLLAWLDERCFCWALPVTGSS